MEEILLVPCVEESAVYLGNYPQWFVPNVLALEVGTETAKSRSARNAVAVVLNQLENCDNIRFARLLKMESNIRALNFIVRLTEQCNLDCAYCYISRESRRSSRTLCGIDKVERLYQLVSEGNVRRVEFVWHGGEPLVFGKGNFSDILSKQDAYFKSNGIVVHNAIQTNGTLIDDDWVKIFKDFAVSVGISIDAPSDLHDELRVHWNRRGSLDSTLRAVSLLKEARLLVSTISVLNKINVSRIREIFDFFQQLEIPFKLNPCSDAENADKNALERFSLSPREYGAALVELFRYYRDTKDLRTSVTDLRDMAASLFTGCNSNCLYAGKCEDFFGMSVNGDLFFCDLFHVEEFRLGNVTSTSLAQMRENQVMKRVARRKDELRGCKSCEWWSVCRGGCATSAFAAYADINREDYFCESRKLIFSYMKANLIAEIPSSPLSNTNQLSPPNQGATNGTETVATSGRTDIVSIATG